MKYNNFYSLITKYSLVFQKEKPIYKASQYIYFKIICVIDKSNGVII